MPVIAKERAQVLREAPLVIHRLKTSFQFPCLRRRELIMAVLGPFRVYTVHARFSKSIKVFREKKQADINFFAALYTSVNHDGDSDSTGAIAGNIIGAYLGYEKMNKQLRAADIDLMQVELAEEMMKLCDGAIECAFGPIRK